MVTFNKAAAQSLRNANHETIDYALEYSHERRRIKLLAQIPGLRGASARVVDAMTPWIVIIFSGLTIGVVASGIVIVTGFLSDLRFGVCSGTWYLSKKACCLGFEDECREWLAYADGYQSILARSLTRYSIYVTLAIIFATTASFLVNSFAKHAFHEGIIEIKAIEGGVKIPSYLSFSTLLIKALGLPLAVSSGLSLGSEGPLVHVAGCIADLLLGLFPVLKNEAKRREILTSASAAGISVAFGAPLGGVLFALEEISTFPGATLWASFVCAVTAGITLQYIDPYNSGRLVLFELLTSRSEVFKAFELIPFVFLGVVGGVFGSLFISLNKQFEIFRRSSGLDQYPISEVLGLSFFTAVISYLCILSRISTSDLVSMLFTDCARTTEETSFGLCDKNAVWSTVFLLLVTAFIKMILTAAVFGASLPSGVFLPSLAIGGLAGRSVGMLISQTQQSYPSFFLFASVCPADGNCVAPAVYAVIGAAAFTAGVTRMTISLTCIIFELTGSIDLVLQIMIAVIVAKLTGDHLSNNDGIYESWINLRNYPVISRKTEYFRDNVIAKQIMTPFSDIIFLTNDGMSVKQLECVLETEGYRGFPITRSSSDSTSLGYISRTELAVALQTAWASPATNSSTPCFFARHSRAKGSPIGDSRHLSAHDTFDLASPGTEQTEFGTHRDTSTTLFDDDKDVTVWFNLKPWVDQTPMALNLDMATEVVVQMFTRLGLRFVLLTKQGKLSGILTKMDLHYHLKTKENELVKPQTRSKSKSKQHTGTS